MAAADVEYRCFVGGRAWATDDQSLERAFSQYGEIVDSKVRVAGDEQNESDPACFSPTSRFTISSMIVRPGDPGDSFSLPSPLRKS
ncbi:Glycine-rich RNA-binding, abscisic acid-inducible protein-like protein [Drosera capensis]